MKTRKILFLILIEKKSEKGTIDRQEMCENFMLLLRVF